MAKYLLYIVIILLVPMAVYPAASVVQSPDKIEINLSNGIKIETLIFNGYILGIGKVWSGSNLLKSDRVLISPQLELAVPGKTYGGEEQLAWGSDPLSGQAQDKSNMSNENYSKCKIISAVVKGEKVIISTEITTSNGKSDNFVWEFQPENAKIKGVKFNGFGYTYKFNSRERQIFSILDTFSWGTGGNIDNTWIMESGHSQGYTVKKKLSIDGDIRIKESPEAQFKIYPQLYDLSNITPLANYTPFDFRFQFGDNGLLFAYNKYPANGVRRILKNSGDSDITYMHRYFYSQKKQAETPEMIVLFTSDLKSPAPLKVEDWHGMVYDYVHNARCEYYGVHPQEMITMAAKAWILCIDPSGIMDDQRYLDAFADLGFQAIWWKGWEDNHDSRRLGSIDYMMNLRPGSSFGGEDAAKEFCDYAHKLDIKVYCWAPTFYTGGRSLLAAEHPEWTLRDYDGRYQYKRFGSSEGNVKNYGTYSELIAYDLSSGYKDNFLASYKHLREIGIDGLWLDSYPNITVDCVPYKAPDRPDYSSTNNIYGLTASLMKMGFMIGYEGSGPLGIPMSGSVTPIIDDQAFGYQRVYGWQKLFWARGYVQEKDLNINFYYMSCANKIPAAIVSAATSSIDVGCPPKLAAWIKNANMDYRKVYKLMQYRHLIPSPENPEQEMAVEWTNDSGKTMVLWSYRPFEYKAANGAKITDVTTGKEVSLQNGVIQTEDWHTYLIKL